MQPTNRKSLKTLALVASSILGAVSAPGLFAASTRLTVTVGTEGVYAPFTFLDEKGVITGYDVEVVQEIAKRVDLDVKFVPTP